MWGYNDKLEIVLFIQDFGRAVLFDQCQVVAALAHAGGESEAEIMGIAMHRAVGTGTDGETKIKVQRASITVVGVTLTQAMVGDIVEVLDDQTVVAAGASVNTIKAGELLRFDSATAGEILIVGGSL